MCGIWGILSNEEIKQNTNILFNKFYSIKARGPDRSVFITNPNYIVGFHRLSIMDTSIQGDQPFSISYYYDNDKGEKMLRTVYVICNGEIYNYQSLKDNKELVEFCNKINYHYKSHSDCEVLLPLFLMTIKENDYKTNPDIFEFGIREMLIKLNGEFAFACYDIHTNLGSQETFYNLWTGRDRFGIRPLFYTNLGNKTIAFGSEMKSLIGIEGYNKVEVHDPRSWYYWGGSTLSDNLKMISKLYYVVGNLPMVLKPDLDDVYRMTRTLLTNSVKARLSSDREIGCLLSGGLDSSLVASIAARELEKEGKKLRTFSIGMEGSPDAYYARIVAEHINSIHTNIEIPQEEWVSAIEEVIRISETYDITTIRATTGQYLVSKWIAQNTNIKVLLIGDGSDEATGGYLYFHKAPSALALHFECKRLLHYIHYFDVLRADRGVSSNGLEARVPYLDHEFINFYFQVEPALRMPTAHKTSDGKTHIYEKYLLRKSFEKTKHLPECVLWRKKEAFSDGVSSESKSWYQIIQDQIEEKMSDEYFEEAKKKYEGFVVPHTKEALYFHEVFDKYYPKQNHILPYYWLPQWMGDVKDPSARTLKIYKEVEK
jgi:asparagine synthase (glutamine-hydrolysing)